MLVTALNELCTKAAGTTKLLTSKNGKSDPSILGVVFMAFVCAVLPLDISQLVFAILGAIVYALWQKSNQNTPKKNALSVVVDKTPCKAAARSTPAKTAPAYTASLPASIRIGQSHGNSIAAFYCSPSVQPIVAPTFHSDSWEGEIQELLLQITPTAEADRIVQQLAQTIRRTMQSIIPEIEVNGYLHGSLTCGKAFGVAVPGIDIIASVSPRVLYDRLHGRKTSSSSRCQSLDEKKLQKSAIRACTDRLVSHGGFKFRRSAFRGLEPKVTLLAPSQMGLFSDSIPIDFSVNVVTPMYNAALLMECGRMDSRATELTSIVRRWAKDRGICHAAKGHLSPYMWGLFSIYFLQVRDSEEGALLPPLEAFCKRTVCSASQRQERSLERLEAFCKQQGKPAQPAAPKKSAAALFKEFIHFYQSQFDWRNEAVAIRAGRRAPPSLELPIHIITSDDSGATQVGPSIEDPFHKAQNLGDTMNATSLARLKEELLRAENICLHSESLSKLLEPWVPAETTEPADDEQCDVKAKPQAELTTCNGKVSLTSKTSVPTTPPWRRPGVASSA